MTVIKITKDGDEITRHGFTSYLEGYLKQLLSDPIHASIDDYLVSHGLNNEELLPLLLKASDKDDENSAILLRRERIKTDPETGRDKFYIKYSIPNKDYDKKIRHLYADLFENYQTDNEFLNEDGACSCGDMCGGDGLFSADGDSETSNGAYVGKMEFPKKNKNDKGDAQSIIRRDMPGAILEKKNKTVYLTEAQIRRLAEEAELDTAFGDFGYDAPALKKKKDKAYDHSNIMADSWDGGKE